MGAITPWGKLRLPPSKHKQSPHWTWIFSSSDKDLESLWEPRLIRWPIRPQFDQHCLLIHPSHSLIQFFLYLDLRLMSVPLRWTEMLDWNIPTMVVLVKFLSYFTTSTFLFDVWGKCPHPTFVGNQQDWVPGWDSATSFVITIKSEVCKA
jgi:hypothetical protein